MTQNINLTDNALEQVNGGINDFPKYDMIGFVVEKIADEKHAYNVKGNNDEIFFCCYDGYDDVAPGTRVYMILNEADNTWKMRQITLM